MLIYFITDRLQDRKLFTSKCEIQYYQEHAYQMSTFVLGDTMSGHVTQVYNKKTTVTVILHWEQAMPCDKTIYDYVIHMGH